MILLVIILFSITTILIFKATTVTVEAATKNGWYWTNTKKTTLCYYKKNKKLTGWQTIGGNVFYFSTATSTKGQMKTGWQKFSNGSYFYFQPKGDVGVRGKTLKGWQTIGGKKYYLTSSGGHGTIGKMYYGWKTISNNKYYFGSSTDGSMKTGWQTIGSNRYYFGASNSGVMRKGWQKLSNKWYYFGNNGIMQKGLKTMNDSKGISRKCYLDGNGVMKTGWLQLDKKWYYFTSDGWAQTGWKNISNKRYYFGSGTADGVMRTGLQTIDKKKYYFGGAGDGNMRKKCWYKHTVNKVDKHYYFGSNGAAVTGVNTLPVGNKKNVYVMDGNGVRQYGWIKSGGKWYYTNKSGVAQKGWLTLSKGKYYLDSNCVMKHGFQTIDKKKYYFGTADDGAMKTGWQKSGSTWYFMDAKGVVKTGWMQDAKNKKYYYLDTTSGAMQTGWLTIGKNKYHLGSDGARRTGLNVITTNIYYMSASGVVQSQQWQTVANKTYYFGSDGKAVKGWHKLKRGTEFNENAYWNYFSETYVLRTDSDIKGCAHGHSTFGDKKHLAGIKNLKYNLYDTGWDARVRTAAQNWNSVADNVNLTEVTAKEDISVRTGELDNAVGQAFFYTTAGTFLYFEIGAGTISWNRAVVILDSTQSNIPTATIAHEFGHTMGLAHRITEKNSIMCSAVYGRTATVPQKTDADNISHIYK